jgi:hypothetical protein
MFNIRSFGIAAIAATLMLLAGAATPSCSVNAQAGCSGECRAAYGACYRATSNRAACEAHMQRCLQGCIASKRG